MLRLKYKKLYTVYIKRMLDIILSGTALFVLSPIMLITYCLIFIKLGRPVLFVQDRPGLHGKTFKMYKFRSMTDQRDKNGNLLPDHIRLTSFGGHLRSLSLDELPELWNVLIGDMSIVGPRPLLIRYLGRYTKRQWHRHDVKPGITGYAQAFGRNAISWEEKFQKDLYYVKNVSLLLDIKIIVQTVRVVLLRKGIHSETSVTMDEFYGTDADKQNKKI